MPHNKTMRITGGTLVRRRFLVPEMVDDGSVRPTPDRVREAVFSMIASDIKDAVVLDIFAGSGAHGFEALSRGAQFVRFIEKNPRVAAVIRENIKLLGLLEQTAVVVADAEKLEQIAVTQPAQVIFVDPPYTLTLGPEFFAALIKFMAPGGFVIYRCFKKQTPAIDARFEILRDRVYGGTRVFVMKLREKE